MRGTRAGASLVEALITLGLLLLIFGVIGELVRGYNQALLVGGGQDAAIEAGAGGLSGLRDELKQAVAVRLPAIGGTGSVLEFDRLIPDLPNRPPDPAPDPWNPYPAGALMTVRYQMQNGRLERSVSIPSGSPFTTQVMARDVQGFSCNNVSVHELRVNLSVRKAKKIEALNSTVFLRVQ